MAFYMFILHIPLSFGGLSVVAKILHEPHLDPQTEVSAFDLSDQYLPFITLCLVSGNNEIGEKKMMKSDLQRKPIIIVALFFFFFF